MTSPLNDTEVTINFDSQSHPGPNRKLHIVAASYHDCATVHLSICELGVPVQLTAEDLRVAANAFIATADMLDRRDAKRTGI